MKISDLLGDGWESDEHSDAQAEPPAAGYTAPVESHSPDVIASLASWAPEPEPGAPETTGAPVSARAQLADLAAGLALPVAPAVEPEPVEAPDELASLTLVVDDLLPDATKRRSSSRGSSRSGSRRRGR